MDGPKNGARGCTEGKYLLEPLHMTKLNLMFPVISYKLHVMPRYPIDHGLTVKERKQNQVSFRVASHATKS